MRLLLMVLLAVLAAAPAFSQQIPVPRGTFYASDPLLEAYRLDQEIVYIEGEEPEPEPEPKPPSFWWRLAGWGVYATCGTAVGAQQYRKSRSYGTGSAFINNDIARVATVAGIAEGSNMGSEVFRQREYTRLSLMTRVGTMAACVYVLSDNFYNGWKRR